MNKYSIIIPVYNTPAGLLEQALDSCVQFKDTEVILYNDGSDRVKYRGIENRYKDKLNLIYIPEIKNVGTLQARRNAMQYVTGKYTLFLDSDDEFMKGAYLDIDQVVSSRPSYAVYRFRNDGCKTGLVDGRLEINQFLMLDNYLPYVTGKVFRTDFINNALNRLDYNGICLGEDTLITLVYLRMMQMNRSLRMYHSNIDIYLIKEPHTSKMYPESYDWNRIKRGYIKMQPYRDVIHALIYDKELFIDYQNEDLIKFKSIRISTDQFIQCDNYYRLIDLIKEEFGWHVTIEYFMSRDITKFALGEYFNKI